MSTEPTPRDPRTPSVSVVVPVFGDRGELRSTLDALLRQDYAGPVEVVLVDNGGNERSPVLGPGAAALPHRPDRVVRVVREERPGSYAARNAGVLTSTAEVLAFTDGDCLPHEAWLSRGVARLLDAPAPAFVGGRVALFRQGGGRPAGAELWELRNGFRQHEYLADQGFAATANMLTRRADLLAVGLFRADFTSGGDAEWGRRATAHGLHGTYAEDAVVDHPCRSTLRALHRKVVRVQRGHADLRAVEGRPETASGLVRSLRPPLKTFARQTRAVADGGRSDAARYLAVAVYVYYLQVAVRVRLTVAPERR